MLDGRPTPSNSLRQTELSAARGAAGRSFSRGEARLGLNRASFDFPCRPPVCNNDEERHLAAGRSRWLPEIPRLAWFVPPRRVPRQRSHLF